MSVPYEEFLKLVSFYEAANLCRDSGEFAASDLLYQRSLSGLNDNELCVFIWYDWALSWDFRGNSPAAGACFEKAVELFQAFESLHPHDERVPAWRSFVEAIEEHLSICRNPSASANDYFLTLYRALPWSSLTNLKIYIDDSLENGFSEDLARLLYQACFVWNTAQLPVSPILVKDRREAQIEIMRVQFLGAQHSAGQTIYQLEHNRLRKACIRLFCRSHTLDALSESEIANLSSLCRHEFGHALGLDGHSPLGTDLMYWKSRSQEPSPRDLATLQRLYSVL